jgi:hypothetical protein
MAPSVTFATVSITPLLAPAIGPSLGWNAFTTATREYLDPTHPKAAAAPQFTLAWTQNPFAETARSVGVYTGVSTQGVLVNVNKGTTPVAARGDTSVVVTAPVGAACDAGTQFGPLDASASTSRQFQLRYRMLDGSYKDSRVQFN